MGLLTWQAVLTVGFKHSAVVLLKKKKVIHATPLQLTHYNDFTCTSKHNLWIFYVGPRGKLWHLQSNQTMATCLLTAGCKKRKNRPFCIPIKIVLKYLFFPAAFWAFFAQMCSVCEWHLHRLVSEARVKDYLQINLCVLIWVQYMVAGIYCTSTIKTLSAKSTGCQSHRNILNWLSNTFLLLSVN